MKNFKLTKTCLIFACVLAFSSCQTDDVSEIIETEQDYQKELFNSFTSTTPVENGISVTLPSGTITRLAKRALNNENPSQKEIQHFLHQQFIKAFSSGELDRGINENARSLTSPNREYIQLISLVEGSNFQDVVVVKEAESYNSMTAIATKRTTSGMANTVARGSVYYFKTNQYNLIIDGEFLAFEFKNTNTYPNNTFNCSGEDEKARGYASWHGATETYNAYAYITCDD